MTPVAINSLQVISHVALLCMSVDHPMSGREAATALKAQGLVLEGQNQGVCSGFDALFC
jgi:hypothetical protein